ncbi:MAG TPA: protein kinase [Polyangiaceae bacterium]|jgi:serine/threonine-protein kinase|nr:protein kinase [Polyangiaceae bacterium]
MKEPAPGVLIAGKYSLEKPLANGGMGSVWVARHLTLDTAVAVKFIGPELASTPAGQSRFAREARAAAHLQNPHVVAIQDYGVDEGLPYIVMELLRGEDLDTRITRLGRLSIKETLTILTQIAKALHHAHKEGIIHRDLKPENIFLVRGRDEEIVKLIDFGIAKGTAGILGGDPTTTGSVMGSPSYMSPEHIRGAKDIDARTDLWSLGVILFQMLTGRLPFESFSVGDILAKIIGGPIPLATSFAPDLPPAVDNFLLKAVSRDRSRRFQSAREMADAFTEVARASELSARSSGPSVSPQPESAPPKVSSVPPLLARSAKAPGPTPVGPAAPFGTTPSGTVFYPSPAPNAGASSQDDLETATTLVKESRAGAPAPTLPLLLAAKPSPMPDARTASENAEVEHPTIRLAPLEEPRATPWGRVSVALALVFLALGGVLFALRP